MPRKCPFGKRWCGLKEPDACETCEFRRQQGQTILTQEKPKVEETTTAITYEARDFTCPYCLYTTTNLAQFQTKTRGGKTSEKMFQCPDCGQKMRRDTLFMQKSVEEFAEWMLDTQAWERVDFAKFRQRLKDIGISYQFWAHYKRHKQELLGTTETYEQFLIRKQQEQREEEEQGYDEEMPGE